jgi:4-hydroxythreonine-4-phosphate dehydrogenase
MAWPGSNERMGLRPRIGITIGDPAGIGPEVALKAASRPDVLAACLPVLIGDAAYLKHWASAFGLATPLALVPSGETISPHAETPLIYDLKNLPAALALGREQAVAGRSAGEYIEAAVQLCLAGQLEAITTAPINKKALHLGGYEFPGHTEMLAHLTGTKEFAMSFIAPNLRVALLTTHLPLAAVSAHVKKDSLTALIQLVQREMMRFGLERPRIAVAALNPHGGEAGLFGTEEAAEMTPAIAVCRAEGVDVSGPHSGDTIFLRAARGEFDIVISCYHDQGLIPIKCFSFGEAVNVTLGLPFIRTSVDHGTGFDIAGQGKADPASMVAAIQLAAQLAQSTKREAS